MGHDEQDLPLCYTAYYTEYRVAYQSLLLKGSGQRQEWGMCNQIHRPYLNLTSRIG